jgi:sugar phosphate isomerase/epimerase
MNKIILAPTTLPQAPPLEYIAAGTEAGFDGLAIRLHPSPGFPFHPIAGDAALTREVKFALRSAPPVYEIGSFYMEPDTDIAGFRPALELGAEFGARYAFVVGNDPEWARMCDSFGRFCDEASRFDLGAFVEFVPMRPLGTLEQTLRLFHETGRSNVAVCIDPLNFARSGALPADIKRIDPRLLPYGQLSDGLVHDDEPTPSPKMRHNVRKLMGEGSVPVAEIVSAMPRGLPYSLELPLELSAGRGPCGGLMTSAAWAKYVLAHAKDFLARHALT